MGNNQDLGKVYSSLAKVINRIENPTNGTINNEYGSSYLPLSDVITTVKTAMRDEGNELSFIQIPEVLYERLSPNYELGVVKITTRIIHSSGIFVDFSPVVFKAGGNTPQSVGSAITYAKRYSLTSLFGISGKEEDDDGNAGSDQPYAEGYQGNNQRNNQGDNQRGNQGYIQKNTYSNNQNNMEEQNNVYDQPQNVPEETKQTFLNTAEQDELRSVAKQISDVRNVEIKTILTALGKPLEQIPANEYEVYLNRLSKWLNKAIEEDEKKEDKQGAVQQTIPLTEQGETAHNNEAELKKSFTVKAIQPRDTPDGQKILEVFVEGSSRSLLCRTDEEKQQASQLEVGDTFTGEIRSDGVFMFLISIENIVKSA